MKKRLDILLKRIDSWLCIYSKPLWFRLRWQKLWVRKYNEFHSSLDTDWDIVMLLKNQDLSTKRRTGKWGTREDEYFHRLVKRRTIAHNATLN